jgi:uncharacterized protein YqeY
MSIKTRLQEEQKLAMRAKDKVRLKTIRSLIAAVKQIELDDKVELDNDAVTAVVVKSVKQRKDSISQFEKAERTDLVDIEKMELVILEEFLPEQMSDEAIAAIVAEVLASTEERNMGKLMGMVMAKVSGKADGNRVSAAVKSALA